MNLVTQSKAAQIVGVKQPVIARYIARGNITKYEGGKVDLEEIIRYRDGAAPVIGKTIDIGKRETIKNKGNIPEYSESRAAREYYQAILSELMAKEKDSKLIPIDDVKAVIDKIATPFSKQMDELPFALKSRYPDISNEAFEWLKEHINSIKMNFQGIYD